MFKVTLKLLVCGEDVAHSMKVVEEALLGLPSIEEIRLILVRADIERVLLAERERGGDVRVADVILTHPEITRGSLAERLQEVISTHPTKAILIDTLKIELTS